MVKRQSAPSLSSFQSVGIDTSMVSIDKSTSMRSIESLSSNTSSLCSNDPAMRRTRHSSCFRSKNFETTRRTIDETKEMICDLHVTFSPILSEVVSEVMNREDFTDKERNELFLTMDDMNKIKNDAKYITKYYRVKDKCIVDSLDQVYTQSIYRSTIFTTYEDFLRFIRNESGELGKIAEQLHPWSQTVKLSGRGLERYCSQKQRRERHIFSSECRAAVVRLSKSNAVSEQDVATFYHEYSRGNTIYARLMGCGDEVAAANVHRSKIEIAIQPKNLIRIAKQLSFDQRNSECDRSSPMEGVIYRGSRDQTTSPTETGISPSVDYIIQGTRSHMDTSSAKLMSLDRRQLFAIQRQSSSAKLLARLSNRTLETI